MQSRNLGFVGFEGLKISCIIGMLDHERAKPQDLFVDLKVIADFSRCVVSDQLEGTIDYFILSERFKQIATSGQYQLLETLASRSLDLLAEEFSLRWASVRIKKPQAIPEASYALVEMERAWTAVRS